MVVKYKNKKYEIYRSTYANNKTLAIFAYRKQELDFVITKNLPDVVTLGDDYQFIDTNNYPWLPDFIEQTKLGEPANITMPLGFCIYPLYRFNIDKIDKI